MNNTEKKVVLITGASSGFGELTTKILCKDDIVYASMRDIEGRNTQKAEEYKTFSKEQIADIRPIEIDVTDDSSIQKAVGKIIADCGKIDILIHNAGHMVYGPSEAFTTEQLAQQYNVNVLGTQRVNRAVLPHMRERREGLLIWVSSSSIAGGVPPFLGPYFAAKSAMDSLAVTYARELTLWGIETSIVVPGAFTKGTNHFDHAAGPKDKEVLQAYAKGPYEGYMDKAMKNIAQTVSEEADVNAVAQAIKEIVDLPKGKRPFRSYVDFANDGSEVSIPVIDSVREEMIHRIDLPELLEVKK